MCYSGKEMKAILLVFTLFNFMCAQVLASSCATMCEFNKVSKAESSQPMPMKANHECCHGKNKKTEDKSTDNPFQCMGDLGGVCLHEASTSPDSFVGLKSIEVSLALPAQPIFYTALILNESPKTSSPPQGIGRQFQKYKEGLRLHILKDQFLI